MLIQGRMWARIVAMILVMLNAFAQIAFMTAFPLWSIVVIALDVVVLWALCVHGEEMEHGY